MTQPAGTGPCRRRRAPFLSGLAAAILSILLLPLLYSRRATVFRAHEELVGYCCLLARGAATDPVLAGPGAFPEGLSAAGTALTGWLQSGSWVEWKTAGSVLRGTFLTNGDDTLYLVEASRVGLPFVSGSSARSRAGLWVSTVALGGGELVSVASCDSALSFLTASLLDPDGL